MIQLVFVFLFTSIHVFAQSNLIANGGFEDENTCSEYNQLCAAEGWFYPVVQNISIAYADRSGFKSNRCVGYFPSVMSATIKNTYLITQLLCALTPRHKYRVQCFITTDNGFAPMSQFGIYFSQKYFEETDIDQFDSTHLLKSKNYVSKEEGWYKMQFEYQADGNEKYLVIGNFNTKTRNTAANAQFVFVDIVSLIPVNEGETICPDWMQKKQQLYNINERHKTFQPNFFRKQFFNSNLSSTIQNGSLAVTIKADTIVLPDILFEYDKYDIKKQMYGLLDSITAAIDTNQVDSISINGHTDSLGTKTYNYILSLNRAKAVFNYLLTRKKMPEKIASVNGFGESIPKQTNSNSAGREKNRRVELIIFWKKK